MRTAFSLRFAAPVATIACLMCWDAASAADAWIENQMDSVNKHYDVASERFDDGTVQMRVRQEGPDGTSHSVYQFDCVNKSYDALYGENEGAVPGAISSDPTRFDLKPFSQQNKVAPIAQHACTKHGHPLLEW